MKFIRSKGIASKKEAGSWLVLEPKGSHVRYLNSVAGFIWELLEKEMSAKQLIAKVVEFYDVKEELAKKDVAEFIDQYERDGLISRV